MIRQQVHTVGTTSPASPLPWQSWMMSCIRVLVTQCCMFHQPRLQNVSHIAAPLRGSVCCRASSLTQPELSPALSATQAETQDPATSPAHCTFYVEGGGETLISQLIQSKYAIVMLPLNKISILNLKRFFTRI